MTRRELNLAVFEGTSKKQILWQPILDEWFIHHSRRGTLPARFSGMDLYSLYDAVRCSVRYGPSYCGMGGIERYEVRDDVVRITERHADHTVEIVRTPKGELRTVYHEIWEDHRRVNNRISEFPVRTAADLRVATDLVERERFRADLEGYRRDDRAIGSRGEPTLGLSSSGYTDLIKHLCGLLETTYLFHDCPKEIEAYLEACDRRDDRLLDAALKLPCRLFNFGDHATNEFTPPPILKKYLIPRWQRLSDRLHREGRFVHSHWDGHSLLMLPYLKETHLDAVEALTPKPMGDMTLEQIKEAVGDKIIVVDLLPVISFLSNYSLGELMDFTKKVIDLFAPKLILGISDELSATGQIERVEAISEYLDKTYGLPD
jgi:hypothetical protein